MIDYLKGKIVHREHDYVIIDVHDVGYKVYVASGFSFPIESSESVLIYTYHQLTSEISRLYGFETRKQQALFLRLIEVSNVGPKVAIGVLAAVQPEALISAVRAQNLAFLQKLPGIGKKTAQQIVLDLKDKFDQQYGFMHEDVDGAMQAGWTEINHVVIGDAAPGPNTGSLQAWREAREGLATLGYKDAELDKAWSELRTTLTEQHTVDQLMKAALKVLYK